MHADYRLAHREQIFQINCGGQICVTGHLVFLLVGFVSASFWSVLTDSHKKSFCSVALETNVTVIVLCDCIFFSNTSLSFWIKSSAKEILLLRGKSWKGDIVTEIRNFICFITVFFLRKEHCWPLALVRRQFYKAGKGNTREGDDEKKPASPLPLCRECLAATTTSRQKLCASWNQSVGYLGPQGTCQVSGRDTR